eukprot:COSAG03_NODE_11431_length_593_cov_0.979757_1_plen_46_part_10
MLPKALTNGSTPGALQPPAAHGPTTSNASQKAQSMVPLSLSLSLSL